MILPIWTVWIIEAVGWIAYEVRAASRVQAEAQCAWRFPGADYELEPPK